MEKPWEGPFGDVCEGPCAPVTVTYCGLIPTSNPPAQAHTLQHGWHTARNMLKPCKGRRRQGMWNNSAGKPMGIRPYLRRGARPLACSSLLATMRLQREG